MPTRLSPLALVMLAACEPGGGVADTPPAIAPQDLVRAALESPGDGSDILEALAEFESAEQWRKVPAGLVVSGRSLETILDAHDSSVRVESCSPSMRPEQSPVRAPDALATTQSSPK